MDCNLGQGPVKEGPLVNFSEVVVHLPEYLVLRPATSWRLLKIWWVGALRHNATEVSLYSECQFPSWGSQTSDAEHAQDATNNFC